MRHVILSSSLLFLLSNQAMASEPRYVGDQFEASVRASASQDAKVIRLLPIGAKIDVLEEEEGEGEFARIRTTDGSEGWIQKRYLSDNPGAKERLNTAQQRIAALNEQIKELKAQGASAKADKTDAESSELAKTNAKLEKELERLRKVAADPLAQNTENEELKKEVLNLKRGIQNFEQENITLRDRSARDWFLIGGGVGLGSIILGMILPSLSFKRRSSWGSL